MAQSKPLILLVEDDPNDVYLFRLGLERASISNPLAVVDDGQGAIDYLAGHGAYADRVKHPFPKLVVLDLKMPGVSGSDVLAWLHVNRLAERCGVVVLSNSDFAIDVEKAMQLGAHDYRVKPRGTFATIALVQSLHDRWLAFPPRTRSGVHSPRTSI